MRKHVCLIQLVLVISGAVALGAQVVWLRYFALIFGNSMRSFSWVTSLFMLGISLGAFVSPLFFKERARANLRVYLWVELVSLIFLGLSFITAIGYGLSLSAWLGPRGFLMEGLLATGLILPVTFLMGVSFPLVCRSYSFTLAIERLYSLNTLGGAVGLILFGILSLIAFGYKLTAVFILVLGVTSFGIVSWICFRGDESERLSKNVNKKLSSGFYKKAVGAALSGASLLMMEVLWFRHLEIILGDRAYLTTIILFIIIFVMGLVASFVPTLLKRFTRSDLLKVFVPVVLILFLLSSLLLPEATYIYYGSPRWSIVKFLYVILSFILPLGLLSFIFPSYISSTRENVRGQNDTAILLFLNSLVGGGASLIASYVLVEGLGVNSIFIFTGALLIMILINERPNKIKATVLSLGLFAGLTLNLSSNELAIAPKDMIVYDKELAQSHFTLLKRDEQLEMYAGNYRIASPFGGAHVEHAQVGLAHLPSLYRDELKNALTMGLGYGITVKALLDVGVEQVDSVEILPPVLESADYFYTSNNLAHLQKSKVDHHIQDARSFLAKTNVKYDLISANTSSPYSLSGSFFLTSEFYQQVVDHLNNGGVFSQLVWGPHLAEIVHTFESVFTHVKAIPGYSKNDFILIGSMERLDRKKTPGDIGEKWPSFKELSLENLLHIGEKKLEVLRSETPRFIISDHRVDILFAKESYMGVLWTYKK